MMLFLVTNTKNHCLQSIFASKTLSVAWGGEGGCNSHMKGTGMLGEKLIF